MDELTTGELAKRGGVNLESIRFYEREGLLPAPPRTRSGYRRFPADSVARIRFIKRAQDLGFTLREVRELLGLRLDSDARCGDVRRHAQAKLADIDRKILDLQRIRAVLHRLTVACPGRGAASACPILESLTTANPVPQSGP